MLEKRERGRIQGLRNFLKYPLLSQERVKLRTSNFVRTFRGSIGKKPITISEKVAVGVRVQGLPEIFRTPYIGCIVRSSLR